MPNERRKQRLRTDINYSRGRRGRPYERAKAHCFATETICRRCGKRVDKSLPHRDPITGKVNIWSKTFGHANELDAHGQPYHGHLEHLHCNSSAGARYGNAKRAGSKTRPARSLPTTDSSADWT